MTSLRFTTEEIKEMYDQKYNSSLSRDIEFDLSLLEYQQLMETKRCKYTFVKLVRGRRNPNCVSLDRIDPDGPYSMSNTVACARIINRAKNDLFEKPKQSKPTIWQVIRLCISLKLLGFRRRP